MKKILLLLLISPFFLACSSDDDNGNEPEGSTTIEVQIEGETPMYDCVAGYKNGDIFKIAGKVGYVSEDKPSKEVKIKAGVTEIYIFGSYMTIPSRIKTPFKIIPDTKNIIVIKKGVSKDIVDITNPNEYPIN